MLIFCVTTLGLILGMSDKISYQVIPLLLSTVLWISSHLAMKSRILQAHNSAYLLKHYCEKNTEIAHDLFYNFYVKQKVMKKGRFKDFIRSCGNFIANPFFILLVICIISEIHYFLKFDLPLGSLDWCYILFIVLLNFFVLSSILKARKLNYFYFQSLYESFSENRN